MKVAIVHELLTRRGGAERIAKIFSEMFPDAPIYTLLYDEQKLGEWFPRERVRTAGLPGTNHHLYLKKFPKVVEAWNFDEFDLVLSSSSAFVHGIITNGNPKHICYVHSPARYLWDATHDVVERAGTGLLGPLKKWYLHRTFHPLRTWDSEAAARPDVLLANSREVQRRIELYWRRESAIVTPPIEDLWFVDEKTLNHLRKCLSDNLPPFLIVSTLTPYKNIDVAIEACKELQLPLTIVGEGPDRSRLEKLAQGSKTSFLGYKTNEEVRDLYAQHSAVLFTSNDDFGLVPLEANACGTPVIALRAGGALETVTDKTGMFFNEATKESLIDAIKNFNANQFSPEHCQANAEKHRKQKFEEQINAVISRTCN